MAGILYLCATPIGNLEDMTYRVVRVLQEVDLIAAEDTRNTLKLLSALDIKNEVVSYHEHNKKQSGERILCRIANGESCALVTDAGMPAISDPGEDIVREAAKAGINTILLEVDDGIEYGPWSRPQRHLRHEFSLTVPGVLSVGR